MIFFGCYLSISSICDLNWISNSYWESGFEEWLDFFELIFVSFNFFFKILNLKTNLYFSIFLCFFCSLRHLQVSEEPNSFHSKIAIGITIASHVQPVLVIWWAKASSPMVQTSYVRNVQKLVCFKPLLDQLNLL